MGEWLEKCCESGYEDGYLENWSSARANEWRRANKEGIFSSHPTQQACQGCLLDVARRLDRCETFQCDICFSFVFHVIETPIVWSLPPRVVRVYAVGSFHPRFSLFARTQIARTPQSNPKITLFLALRTFRAWRLIELLLHERSLAHLACEPLPYNIQYNILLLTGCIRIYVFLQIINIIGRTNTFYILFDRDRWDWN